MSKFMCLHAAVCCRWSVACCTFRRSRNWFGFIIGLLTIGWCTVTAATYFDVALKKDNKPLTDLKWLLAYPICLCYSSFALITLF